MADLDAEGVRKTCVWQKRTVYQKMVCATSLLELCSEPLANHIRRIAYALAIDRNLGCDVGGIIPSFLPPACPGHARPRPCLPIPPPVPTAMSPGATVLLPRPPFEPHYCLGPTKRRWLRHSLVRDTALTLGLVRLVLSWC